MYFGFFFFLDFKKVPKHFLDFDTDENNSTVLIKNGSLLYFNHMWKFWSRSLLSQLERFNILVVKKGLI